MSFILLPDSVTDIGYCAFYNCSSLNEMSIPDGVTEIDFYTFYGCDCLKSVSIPASVKRIDNSAFTKCVSLNNINIDNKNFYYIVEDNALYDIDKTKLLCCLAKNGETSFYIPSSVTNMGNSIFESCTSLKIISLPDSITALGDSVFAYCENLTNVSIPKGVATIGNRTFYSCTNLKNIYIPDTIKRIGYLAFYDSGLENIYGFTDSYAEMYAEDNEYNFIACKKGNIDCNAYTDIQDVTALQKYLMGINADSYNSAYIKAVGDVNNDSVIDVQDITEIQKYIVGITDTLG